MRRAAVIVGSVAVALAIGVLASSGGYRAAEPDGPTLVPVDVVQAAFGAGKPVVAEFGSVSCVSCREMKPILAELQRTHGEKLTVVDIDVLKERQYLARYRIQLMPTQVFFDAQGREIGRHMGKISGDEILVRLGEALR